MTAIAPDAGVAVKYCCVRALTLFGWVGCQDTLRNHCSCCAWAVLKCSLSLQLSDLVGSTYHLCCLWLSQTRALCFVCSRRQDCVKAMSIGQPVLPSQCVLVQPITHCTLSAWYVVHHPAASLGSCTSRLLVRPRLVWCVMCWCSGAQLVRHALRLVEPLLGMRRLCSVQLCCTWLCVRGCLHPCSTCCLLRKCAQCSPADCQNCVYAMLLAAATCWLEARTVLQRRCILAVYFAPCHTLGFVLPPDAFALLCASYGGAASHLLAGGTEHLPVFIITHTDTSIFRMYTGLDFATPHQCGQVVQSMLPVLFHPGFCHLLFPYPHRSCWRILTPL